ncbi:hypothetical protein pdam_00013833 [Pocillopora damicornis]|uniref:Uncharacterized protein n=1 Tax=Pocillopora damicornis TaxID=46731 RepID=A0A3M6UWV8_POCDA|nr:hypothetical protein pdam_00013833 [Pocillopora damicornis]
MESSSPRLFFSAFRGPLSGDSPSLEPCVPFTREAESTAQDITGALSADDARGYWVKSDPTPSES